MNNELDTLFHSIDTQVENNATLQSFMKDIKKELKNSVQKNSALFSKLSKNEKVDLEISIIAELQTGLKVVEAKNCDNKAKNFLVYMYVENARLLLCENGYNYVNKEDRKKLLMAARG